MNRRTFLQRMGESALLCAGFAAGKPATAQNRPAQPNLIVFLVDDMGWQDTSVPFHTELTPFNRRYHTPSMERLASKGMKFTQAYSCSVCTPTRVSLMTGLNAARHRVTNWTLRKNTPTDAAHPALDFSGWNMNGLSPVPGIESTVHASALPELLRQAGYRTIHIGKAHFGAVGTPGEKPENLGFDINVGGHAAGAPGSYLGTENYSGTSRRKEALWDVPGLEKYHGSDVFLTEALTREANTAVSKAVADGKPFFLYMAHYAVHLPYAKDARFIQKFEEAGLDPIEAQYAAMIEGMDKSLGDILDNLKRLGVEENTAVLFLSDNGGLSAQGRGGDPHTHNKPLSSGKGSAHEGGIRVPMIAQWPGVIAPGTVCAHPVIVEDFFPTLLEMADISGVTQIGGVIDGRSFVPFLKNPGSPASDRPLFWHYPNHWGPKGPGIGPYSTIRKQDWKLIYYHETQSYELFHLAEDLGETNNLSESQPERRQALAQELREYLLQVNAVMPTVKATGKPVPLP